MKLAELSIGLRGHGEEKYLCKFDWPEEGCFCQAGTDGIVFETRKDGGSYRTAFFEAFPRNPSTFIRGEGATVEDAERSAWEQYQKIIHCPEHLFERRGYTNGGAICKNCGLFQVVFEPSTKCITCGNPTDWTYDVDGNYYCEEHQKDKPLEKWTFSDWHIAWSENSMFNHLHVRKS